MTVKKLLSRIVAYVAATTAAIIPTMVAGKALVVWAKVERGYFAIGGEWILIAAVFIVNVAFAIKALRERRR